MSVPPIDPLRLGPVKLIDAALGFTGLSIEQDEYKGVPAALSPWYI